MPTITPAPLGSAVTVVEMTSGLLPGADRDLVLPLHKRGNRLFVATSDLRSRGGAIDGVAAMRAVDGNDGDRTIAFDEHGAVAGVSHVSVRRPGSRRWTRRSRSGAGRGARSIEAIEAAVGLGERFADCAPRTVWSIRRNTAGSLTASSRSSAITTIGPSVMNLTRLGKNGRAR